MNSLSKLLAAFLLLGLIFSYSCNNDDDDPSGCNYVTETQDELNAVNAALSTYTADPTPANCQALKNAYQVYLDDLENHVSCAELSGQAAEIQSAINSAQASIDTIC